MSQFLEDGYQTLITFSSNPAVKLREKTVTPPGIDGGDAVEQTTMRNTAWRTFASRKLKTLSESTFTASYDPECLNDLNAMINVNQLLEITFPDESKWQFWGYLRVFTPGENTEGEQPTAECGITPTNRNGAGAETAPVYVAAP